MPGVYPVGRCGSKLEVDLLVGVSQGLWAGLWGLRAPPRPGPPGFTRWGESPPDAGTWRPSDQPEALAVRSSCCASLAGLMPAAPKTG